MPKVYQSSIVQKYIQEQIVKDNLKPGDELPSEGKIAAELGISRGSVREALRTLKGMGLIDIQHGTGIFLRGFNLDAFLEIFEYSVLLDPSAIIDLYEIRKTLEVAIVPKIIEKIDDSIIARCENILNDWKESISTNNPIYELDRLFHDTLYKPVGNKIFSELSKIFWYAFRNAEIDSNNKLSSLGKQYDQIEILNDHIKLLDAIKKKDVKEATLQMSAHFKGIKERLAVTSQKKF